MQKKFLLSAIWIILTAATGCGGSYSPKPPEEVSFLGRAETQSRGGLTVTVAVLSREESEEVFGVDLAANGVQPVWLDIENNTGKPYFFMPIALDPDYFSPNEVAFMNHLKFNRSANREMDEQFSNYGIQIEFIMPGERDKGFVYTNLDPGLKFVNVTLYEIDGTENFFFYFEVPGIQPDYENVDFTALYTKDELVHIEDEAELRRALEALPCCTTGSDGGGGGEPINVVLIGDPDDISSAVVRRKWDVTEADTGTFKFDLGKAFSPESYRTFPMASLYLFGRRQDVSLQKSRRETDAAYRQRNTLRLWLTPVRYKGKTVWAGAVSRDIGSDLRIRKYWFAAQEIDPDIDETRDYLVEDVVLSQNVDKLGYVDGVGVSTSGDPRYNLSKLPWWSDGYRAVLLFGKDQITLGDLGYFEWEDVDAIYDGGTGGGGTGAADEGAQGK
ncbi:MAG: LssY C-terminal domain-containing protein [Candidatus Dadabacteria bacterium]|nr:LssY C-terminal domain-containing protein [Candidatus Dadabacteria bacterium]